MSVALIFSKVKEAHLIVPENAEELRADFIRPAFYWIQEVYIGEYTDYKRIRDLCTEEIWTRYFLWTPDFDDHREMIMLRHAASALRKRIVSRTRPDFFKKGKIYGALKRTHSTQTKATSSK